MRKNFLFKYILSGLLILGLAVCFTSCEDVNDWGTDDSYNRVFSPVTFETSRIGATSVDLVFSNVSNAGAYVMEFSKDSLEFKTITNTIEIPADSIVLDSTFVSQLFMITVKKLDPEIRYSVRMKVTSNKNLPESRWVALTFKTPGEQILNAVSDITESSATITWEAESEVTHILLSGGGFNKKEIRLSASEIAESRLELKDLKQNTLYSIEIYNGEKRKGVKTFTTAQKISGDGKQYVLKGTENIVEFLNTIKDTEVVLVIPTTAKFEIGDAWTLPAHIKSLTLWGLAGEGQASINFKEIKLDNSVSNFKIWIHNMKVSGTDAAADYVLNDNPTTARSISEFKMDNCIIDSFRGIIRMRAALTVGLIDIDNCIISNIGSYGLVSIDATSVSVGDISLKNSTVSKLNNTNVITCKSKPALVSISHCTFYDAQAKDKYIINFDGKAANMASRLGINDCLFAASDASISTRATNPKLEDTFVFDSYKTTDYTVASGYPLTGVSDYNNTSANLFTDPSTGNFKIKDTSIGGDKQPGDPRWW
ncbi:uncharacterized protein DUF4957 [Dysgonomonas alginatilytica]|uniref:Uncharacterized protein DUF4957 n=1 Tax=Dysgonomonas alginatilytica TaxID=1605892 RepID=A0A2V3PN63_9BACT|nr:DUF5123 domain-containing protein [Dysgonomonas alginatilytica]PXV63599.1 uncharacterized protein DUF4957 [Dysgonomonas alginatilytica]